MCFVHLLSLFLLYLNNGTDIQPTNLLTQLKHHERFKKASNYHFKRHHFLFYTFNSCLNC